jgi:hypothetical protein
MLDDNLSHLSTQATPPCVLKNWKPKCEENKSRGVHLKNYVLRLVGVYEVYICLTHLIEYDREVAALARLDHLFGSSC